MKLRKFTTETNEDGSQIVRASGRVADNADPEEQTEWITFQLAVDAPTVRNGALLRSEALGIAQSILDQLAKDFLRLGDKYRS
jgi:hypothetical protein